MARGDPLELDPIKVARASLVGRVGLFGDDALQTLRNRLLEDALEKGISLVAITSGYI
jgi:hypothetical protein